MAGLYFHIPFCRKICGYCDFRRTAQIALLPSVLKKMHDELARENGFIEDRKVNTIYFGGGTPSLVEPEEIEKFISETRELFDCRDLQEITLEANPDDLSEEYIARLRKTSVNRISVGIQSLDDDVLCFMNRRHTAIEAEVAVRRLQEAGFDNISVDVIFGVEPSSKESLKETLMKILGWNVQHVSAYHLTIEPATKFGRLLEKGKLHLVDESRSEEEFSLVHSLLTEAGFEHYEISNFAKDGYRSRHNSSYWNDIPYLGIGPGAHSYNGRVRRWCEQNVKDYMDKVEYSEEEIDQKTRLEEYIMTSLRRKEGLSLCYISRNWGDAETDRIQKLSEGLVNDGLLHKNGDRLAIPEDKFLLSDYVIGTLF